MELAMRNAVRFAAAWRALLRMGPFLVSHHPHCGPFRSDVLVAWRRRWCIACFIGYPMIVLGWVGSAWLDQGVPWIAWMAAGLVLASAQGMSFAGRVPDWRAQVAVKVSLGLGLGMFCHGVTSTPLHWAARLFLLAASLAAIQSLWVLRFHRLERTCQRCPQLSARPHCEGLRDLTSRVGPVLGLPGSESGWIEVG